VVGRLHIIVIRVATTPELLAFTEFGADPTPFETNLNSNGSK
jgi:hypothetical protein